MSLVRFSHTPDFLTDLKNKIRHLYDLHKMLEDDELNAFFESSQFEEMLHNVARNDYETLRNKKDWLKIHPNKAAIFLNLENIWPSLMRSYSIDFKPLVYGDFPGAHLILITMKRVKERVKDIDWKII